MTRSIIIRGLLVLSLAFLAQTVAADTADNATGFWKNAKTNLVVEIYKCGTGLCSRIVSGPGRDKRTRGPVADIRLFRGLRKKQPNQWLGVIYNPVDGGDYASTLTVINHATLQIEGCLLGFKCHKQVWDRIPK